MGSCNSSPIILHRPSHTPVWPKIPTPPEPLIGPVQPMIFPNSILQIIVMYLNYDERFIHVLPHSIMLDWHKNTHFEIKKCNHFDGKARSTFLYVNGILHSPVQPTLVIQSDNHTHIEHWYLDGEGHRFDNLPSIIERPGPYGYMLLYLRHNKLHRDDGPATHTQNIKTTIQYYNHGVSTSNIITLPRFASVKYENLSS